MSGANGNGTRRKANRDEFEAATSGLYFTKDFNTALDAVIADEMATNGQRVLSWIKRRAWGNYCLHCVDDDGEPAIQADCSRELKLNKGTVSATVKYLEARDLVRVEGKLLYPVLGPDPEAKSKKVDPASTFQTFLQNWKVANASTFQELEVADATAKRIRLVIHCQYREFRRSQQSAVPPLSETVQTPEDYKEEESGRRASSVAVEHPPETARPPASPLAITRKEVVRAWLTGKFPLPTAIRPHVLDEIVAHIPDDLVFEQFCEECKNLKPYSWKVFIKIARDCEANRETYAMVKAAGAGEDGEPPPRKLNAYEQDREDAIHGRGKYA